MADIVRRHGDRFLAMHRAWLTRQHRRVLRALVQCRTAALGGHRDRCDQCTQSGFSYAKPLFGSPAHVLHYLAQYTHRVAISNHRLVAVTDDTVSFRCKDYRHGSQVRP